MTKLQLKWRTTERTMPSGELMTAFSCYYERMLIVIREY